MRSEICITALGKANNDTGEDEQRNAVSNASFGDLLTEPHHEDRTGRQRDHDHKRSPPRMSSMMLLRSKARSR
jgi:hypothetical protein